MLEARAGKTFHQIAPNTFVMLTDPDRPTASDAAPEHSRTILVDAHVHFYSCFAMPAFLDGAARNFTLAQRRLELDSAERFLMICSTEAEHPLDPIAARCVGELNGWRVEPMEDTLALRAFRDEGEELILISGRQVVTSEGLEVLALGTAAGIPSGQSIYGTINNVQQSGAVAVLPWGFGKWWFRRGSVVAHLLESDSSLSSDLFLGDNGGRYQHLGQPRMFQLARQHSIPVLPGSDPLPLVSHEDRVGSYGACLPSVSLPHDFSMNIYPSERVKQALTVNKGQIQSFGRLEKAWRFVRNQVSMQWRKVQVKGRAGRT